jgi:hypothetical protein
MNRRWLFILFLPFLICSLSLTSGWKDLDLGAFKISIPQEWNYKKVQGDDSFIGDILGPKSLLSFDFSDTGYAADIMPTDSVATAIKIYHIKIDTTAKYIIKTIWPIVPGKGYTGIYYKSRSSSLTFNLGGVNLPAKEQKLALQAFKTIKIKD